MPWLGQYRRLSQYKPEALLSAIGMLVGEKRQSDDKNKYTDTVPDVEAYIDF